MILAVLMTVLTLGTSSICNAQSAKESNEALDLMVRETNKQMPIDYGNGLINTKLVREGNYIVYYYSCNEDYYDIDLMNESIPTMKAEILKELNVDSFLFNELRKTCKNAGCGIAYFYVGKTSGKIAKVFIKPKELR